MYRARPDIYVAHRQRYDPPLNTTCRAGTATAPSGSHPPAPGTLCDGRPYSMKHAATLSDVKTATRHQVSAGQSATGERPETDPARCAIRLPQPWIEKDRC